MSLNLWSIWWPTYAILHNYNLVQTNYILFPIYTNVFPLISLPTSLVYGLLRPIFGPILAYNLILPLFGFLNAFSIYIFFSKYLNNPYFAALGAGVVAFNPITYEIAQQSELPLLAIFVIPICLLSFERFLNTPRSLNGVIAGLALYLVIITSIYFWTLILTVLLPYVIYRLYQRRFGWRSLRPALWGSILFLLLLFIFPINVIIGSSVLHRYSPLVALQGQLYSLSPFLAVMLIVAALALRWGSHDQESSKITRYLVGFILVTNLLCFILPTLSPLNLSGILSLSGTIHVSEFLLPIIAVAVLLVLRRIEAHKEAITPKRLWISLLTLVLVSQWWIPLASTTVPQLNYYEILAREPEDYVIADYPVGIVTSAEQLSIPMESAVSDAQQIGSSFRAAATLLSEPFHQKRLIGGVALYLRPDDILPYKINPLLRILTAQPVSEDLQVLAQKFRDASLRWRVGYIFVHTDVLDSESLSFIHQWLTWTNVYCYVTLENQVEIWRARWNPAGCGPSTFSIGDPNARMMLGAGWYGEEKWDQTSVRWAGQQTDSHLSFWITPQADFQMKLQIYSTANEQQSLVVKANGETLGKVALTKDWHDYLFLLPRRLISMSQGLVSLELIHDQTFSIEGRELTAAYGTMTLEEEHP